MFILTQENTALKQTLQTKKKHISCKKLTSSYWNEALPVWVVSLLRNWSEKQRHIKKKPHEFYYTIYFFCFSVIVGILFFYCFNKAVWLSIKTSWKNIILCCPLNPVYNLNTRKKKDQAIFKEPKKGPLSRIFTAMSSLMHFLTDSPVRARSLTAQLTNSSKGILPFRL